MYRMTESLILVKTKVSFCRQRFPDLLLQLNYGAPSKGPLPVAPIWDFERPSSPYLLKVASMGLPSRHSLNDQNVIHAILTHTVDVDPMRYELLHIEIRVELPKS